MSPVLHAATIVALAITLGCVPRAASHRPESSSWRTPETLAKDVAELCVAVDGRGHDVVAWLESSRPSSGVVHVASRSDVTSARWDEQSASGALPGHAHALRLAAGADGTAVAVWRQVVDDSGRVYASARSPAGAWILPAEPDALSFPPDAYEPSAAVGDDGELLVAWRQSTARGKGISVARRPPSSVDWIRAADGDDVISPPEIFANAPQVVINSKGAALISWFQSTGSALNAFVSERAGRAVEFVRPTRSEHLSINDERPEGRGGRFLDSTTVTLDSHGRAALAWTQPASADAVPVFLATREPDGRWITPDDLDDSFSTPHGRARDPRLAVGGRDELFVAWRHDHAETSAVRLAHRDARGDWVRPGREPLTISDLQWRADTPAIDAGRDRTVIAWVEHRRQRARVVARVADRGIWGPPAVLADSADGRLHAVDAAIGGPGDRVIVAWIDHGSLRLSRLPGPAD